MLLSILIRSMGSVIDGFQDMEIRVSTKFSLIHVHVSSIGGETGT